MHLLRWLTRLWLCFNNMCLVHEITFFFKFNSSEFSSVTLFWYNISAQKIKVCITFIFQIINDDALYVKWDDSHESTYDLQWLLERNFNEDQERREYQQIKWTAESFSTMLRSFKYENVIKRSYYRIIYLHNIIHNLMNWAELNEPTTTWYFDIIVFYWKYIFRPYNCGSR